MATTRPNVLLLLSDEHSFRYLGRRPASAGGEPVHTPVLDHLIDHGTWFTDAYCQMPLCTPSRLSLLTGREAAPAGAWHNCSVLKPGLPTLPGLLADDGYTTCLVGKMHFGGRHQFGGFQHRPYGDLLGSGTHQDEPLLDPHRHSMRMRTQGAGVTALPESLVQDQIVAHETVAFLREHAHARPEQPWFLCASFSRPHFPLTAPARHFHRYWPHGVTPPPVPAAGDAWEHPMSVGMRRGFKADAVDAAETARARAAYFACVSYLDEVLGDLLGRLAADGLLEDTIIVYTSDHGELAGEHGVWWKNGWYEGCTRVPLIVSTPAQRRGEQPAAQRATPVGLVDLVPTLCDLTGAPPPPALDGRSLAAVVNHGAELPAAPVVCDSLAPRWGAGTEFRMVRQGDWKYIRFRGAPPLLFHLGDDPGEQRNRLARPGAAETAALAQLQPIADRLDFDQAERDRQADEARAAAEPLPAPHGRHNVYLLGDGRLVAPEACLYTPADQPLARELFLDLPPAG